MIEKWFETFSLLQEITSVTGLGSTEISFTPAMTFSGVVSWQSGEERNAAGQLVLADIFYALCDHLTGIGLPFFLADCVPQGNLLPYLAADIQPPLSPDAEGTLTLTYWCAGAASNSHRLNQADRVAECFPSRGLWLAASSGTIVILPEQGVQCVTQHGVQGVVFRFRLQFFPTE